MSALLGTVFRVMFFVVVCFGFCFLWFFLFLFVCLFRTWTISVNSLLACRVSDDKSAVSLIGDPLNVICHFPFTHFRIFFCFAFDSLTINVSWRGSFIIMSIRVLCASCT